MGIYPRTCRCFWKHIHLQHVVLLPDSPATGYHEDEDEEEDEDEDEENLFPMVSRSSNRLVILNRNSNKTATTPRKFLSTYSHSSRLSACNRLMARQRDRDV